MSTTTADTSTQDSSAPKTFADFGVEKAICDSLTAVGITSPFPIQEMTLPLALTGADIIGQARTGTGKTLGFGLPLLQRTDLSGGLQSLVIVPTRELCLQVAEDLQQAGRDKGVKVVAVYGGKAMQPQIDALEDGAHMVVGTPGRLLDLSRRGHLQLGGVSGLVLDEADEMLDLGFLPDVEQLIEQTAEQRQTLLFSATMPSAIVALARRYMTKPTFMRAEVEEITIAPQTRQHFFSCHRMDKPAVVARILQTPNRGLCVVFCRTKRMADILAEELRERDVAAQAIHSDLRQDARERVMQKFRDGKVTVLCATEVAARGLDIDDVTHVVNYDCPDDEKMYLHRIGRTGRAGADGVAITFAVWNELPRLEMIRRELDIDEPIHEVFSTSPLLDELFDLPAREEVKKVPSPPQARSGKSSRSRKRGEEEGERSSRGRAPKADRDDSSSKDRDDAKPTSSRSSRSKKSDEDEGGTTTRRRTRSRSESGPDRDSKGRDSKSRDDTPRDDKDESADDGPRRRTRTRTRSRSTGDDSGSGRRSSQASDDDPAGSGDSDGGDGRTRTRTRTARSGDDDRGGRGGRGSETAGGGRSGRSDSDDKVGGSGDGGGRDRGGRGRGGRNRDGGRDDKPRSDKNRSDKSRGDKSREGRGRDGGGRDGGRSGRGNGRSSKPAVDHETARGDGQPRLNRPLEVQHLP